MCNLYSLTPKEDDVGRFFRVSHNRRAAFNIACVGADEALEKTNSGITP